MYDARRGKQSFKKFYIDDYIPCHQDRKTPVFAQPNENELYVLLLEKAFAKFVGNYGRLDGDYTLCFQAMTGCHCMRLEYDSNENNNTNNQEKEERYDEQENEDEDEERR